MSDKLLFSFLAFISIAIGVAGGITDLFPAWYGVTTGVSGLIPILVGTKELKDSRGALGGSLAAAVIASLFIGNEVSADPEIGFVGGFLFFLLPAVSFSGIGTMVAQRSKIIARAVVTSLPIPHSSLLTIELLTLNSETDEWKSTGGELVADMVAWTDQLRVGDFVRVSISSNGDTTIISTERALSTDEAQ